MSVKLPGELKNHRLLIIALLLGLLLLLLPTHGREEKSVSAEESFAKLLSQSEGVGRAEVLISDSGVVIVCDGARDALVKLNVVQAAQAYTGFSSDKIQVLCSEREE